MAEREVRSDPRMTDLEALMWNLDKDPHLTSAFANVTVLDQAPDREYLRRKLARAVVDIPRLRQRVVPALGRLAPPTWQEDDGFDLDYHLRWTALPAPGDHHQLLELATRIHQQPFERGRPLWEFVVVEGLADGKAAMIQRLHHTVTDGVGGLRLAERFLDLERHPTGSLPADGGQRGRGDLGPGCHDYPACAAASTASAASAPAASAPFAPSPTGSRRDETTTSGPSSVCTARRTPWVTSGCSRRNAVAFWRPWPSRSSPKLKYEPDFWTIFRSSPTSRTLPSQEIPSP